MCGILAVLRKSEQSISVEKISEMSSRMSHRGPDERDVHVMENGYVLCHERLSIVDLHTGKQPIQGTDTAWMVHNGEIYNHGDIRKMLSHHHWRSTSDSEAIVHLYEEYGYDICNMLHGIFAFVVVDGDKFIAGRDPIGVKPMYYGRLADGSICFASEMKAIEKECEDVAAFPPGHYYTPEDGFVQYFKPAWFDDKVCNRPLELDVLRDALIESTRKRLMADVPIGVLLSGGLDSSLTSAIAARLLAEQGKVLHSFSIGLDDNAPDAVAAKKVADFIGTKHHNIHFTVEQGIEIIDKLIWHLETYDVTSIRASTPMYFLSKAITDMGIKVVLSGEGSDEIFGGYLYFYNAPSLEEFQKETISRVQRLSTADCLRADKSTMAHGLEARVPFLDKHFLQVAMRIAPEHKMPIKGQKVEKEILRQAFDDKENPWLPDEILWRQKEQFSDGVGYNWIDELMEYCSSQVSDEDMAKAAELFPHNTPDTKEAFFMRRIFHKHYPSDAAAHTVLKWIPKWQENKDPSGRANKVHEQTIEK